MTQPKPFIKKIADAFAVTIGSGMAIGIIGLFGWAGSMIFQIAGTQKEIQSDLRHALKSLESIENRSKQHLDVNVEKLTEYDLRLKYIESHPLMFRKGHVDKKSKEFEDTKKTHKDMYIQQQAKE